MNANVSDDAQAGLNLNVFGALSGVFSSKSKKETEADGSTTETREENLAASGRWMCRLACSVVVVG